MREALENAWAALRIEQSIRLSRQQAPPLTPPQRSLMGFTAPPARLGEVSATLTLPVN